MEDENITITRGTGVYRKTLDRSKDLKVEKFERDSEVRFLATETGDKFDER